MGKKKYGATKLIFDGSLICEVNHDSDTQSGSYVLYGSNRDNELLKMSFFQLSCLKDSYLMQIIGSKL